MATKKQQRRRQKERRHEYEVVYVDEEGNEVEAPPEATEAPARPAKAKPAAAGKHQTRGGRRPLREIKPPSWRRSARRALIFGPGILIFLFLVNKNHEVKAAEIVLILAYTALFIPTFYWVDRLAYRRYLRMTGGAPPTKKS